MEYVFSIVSSLDADLVVRTGCLLLLANRNLTIAWSGNSRAETLKTNDSLRPINLLCSYEAYFI